VPAGGTASAQSPSASSVQQQSNPASLGTSCFFLKFWVEIFVLLTMLKPESLKVASGMATELQSQQTTAA